MTISKLTGPTDLMLVSEVAEYLRVSRFTVYREIKRGHLIATRVGGHVRVRRSHLMAYANGVR